MGGGTQYPLRLSLGCRRCRSHANLCSRVGQPECGLAILQQHPDFGGTTPGDPYNPDCVRGGFRSSGRWFRRKSFASRRQHNGLQQFRPTHGREVAGFAQADCAQHCECAAIFNPDTAPHSLFLPSTKAAALTYAVEFVTARVRNVAEIESAIAAARESGGGLIVMPDASNTVHRAQIVALAAQHNVPAVYYQRVFAASGGLMSYGTDLIDQHRRAAGYVDRILKGEKPADLPVQAPTKFELVINLKTAKALGLDVPPTLLARADEVIE